MIGRRFTIRDLFSLTLALALGCGSFVNLPHLATAIGKVCDGVWQ
jgi:hypothetical protein